MFERTAQLSRAGAVGATHRCFVVAVNGFAARRTNGRHFVRKRVLRAFRRVDRNDLWYDVARFLHRHGVADANVAFGDEIDIVKRGSAYGRSREPHGIEPCVGR